VQKEKAKKQKEKESESAEEMMKEGNQVHSYYTQ
jgi:hypothetical protein